MYYLQYLVSILSPLNSQKMLLVVVNVAHCQQVGTAGSKNIRVTQTNGMHQCTLIVLCNGHVSM